MISFIDKNQYYRRLLELDSWQLCTPNKEVMQNSKLENLNYEGDQLQNCRLLILCDKPALEKILKFLSNWLSSLVKEKSSNYLLASTFLVNASAPEPFSHQELNRWFSHSKPGLCLIFSKKDLFNLTKRNTSHRKVIHMPIERTLNMAFKKGLFSKQLFIEDLLR